MTPPDARTVLEALARARLAGRGRPAGVVILEPRGKWLARARIAHGRGFLAIGAITPKGLSLRALAGVSVWLQPLDEGEESTEWTAAWVAAILQAGPRDLYLHPLSWPRERDAAVLWAPYVKPEDVPPPDAPWGATWDWIHARLARYERLLDLCITEGWELPAWATARVAKLNSWLERRGTYGY